MEKRKKNNFKYLNMLSIERNSFIFERRHFSELITAITQGKRDPSVDTLQFGKIKINWNRQKPYLCKIIYIKSTLYISLKAKQDPILS